MTETELNDWLEKYGRAWTTQDPDAAASIFTEDGTYAWSPFTEPLRGREAIRSAWHQATQEQPEDIRFGHEILSVTKERGIARWWASMNVKSTAQVVRREGIYLITLPTGKLCTELREWWNEDPPATDAAEYQ